MNGKIVPLNYELKTGDIVGIITSSASKGPSRDWLKTVKSTQARSRIRQWFKKELKEENIIKGRDMLEKEAKRQGYDFKTLFKAEWVKGVFKKFTLNSVEDMYAAVGYGGITTGQIITRLKDEYKKENKIIETKVEDLRPVRSGMTSEEKGVMVKGHSGMLVRFAKCCNPLPGDDIVGYNHKRQGRVRTPA